MITNIIMRSVLESAVYWLVGQEKEILFVSRQIGIYNQHPINLLLLLLLE